MVSMYIIAGHLLRRICTSAWKEMEDRKPSGKTCVVDIIMSSIKWKIEIKKIILDDRKSSISRRRTWHREDSSALSTLAPPLHCPGQMSQASDQMFGQETLAFHLQSLRIKT